MLVVGVMVGALAVVVVAVDAFEDGDLVVVTDDLTAVVVADDVNGDLTVVVEEIVCGLTVVATVLFNVAGVAAVVVLRPPPLVAGALDDVDAVTTVGGVVLALVVDVFTVDEAGCLVEDGALEVGDRMVVVKVIGGLLELLLPRVVVTFGAVVVAGLLVGSTGLPLRIAFPWTAALATADPASPEGLLSLPPCDGKGSLTDASLTLCLELDSLLLSFFLLGFFMFLTTLPLDLTGARLLFIGIVAILGNGEATGRSKPSVDVASVDAALVDAATVVVVAATGFLQFSAFCTVVFSVVVVDCSHLSLHLHGLLLLLSTGKAKRGQKKKKKLKKYASNLIPRKPVF